MVVTCSFIMCEVHIVAHMGLPAITPAEANAFETAGNRHRVARKHVLGSTYNHYKVKVRLFCRYGPQLKVADNSYRWFSSVLIYNSFVHIASTLLLFTVLAAQLEKRFGTKRIFLLALLAAVGGNFFGAAFGVSGSIVRLLQDSMLWLICLVV